MDISDRIIAVYMGGSGGTAHTYKYALKKGIEVIRINPTDYSVTRSGKKPLKVLECSSKGDRRFSYFYAQVTIFGKTDSIENHYQLVKRFGDSIPQTWQDTKGKKPSHIEIHGKRFGIEWLTPWFKLLWLKYLDAHPELVGFAKEFD